MIERGADEIVLETEEQNVPAMKLYERLGFLRSKKLHRYYLNGSEAYRLVLKVRREGDWSTDAGKGKEGSRLDEREAGMKLEGDNGI